jgi:ABC-2 type transport system permease protein
MSQDMETWVSNSKFHGLWALTNRELKKWYQQPHVFIMGIVQPVLWLALLGQAMNLRAMIPTDIPGVNQSTIMMATFGTTDYFSFMSMAMLAFTSVFTTAFVGMSLVWDKRLGFMNKVLSTPVSRSIIILAKVLSASIRCLFQSAIVTVVAFILGLQLGSNFTAFSVLGVFAFVFLISVGLSALFTTVTLRATRIELPQAFFQLVNLPLMFASSAYFPIDKMPEWLQAIASVNPISYAIDGIRRLMIFSDGYSGLLFDFAFVGAFATIITAVCIGLSWRFLNK